MTGIFSATHELLLIKSVLSNYLRLPISQASIPGDFMEGALAYVRDAERLNTYDYIDILDRDRRLGWSIKSTKETTPVTWKRAKIPYQNELMEASKSNAQDLQKLGNSIMDFCNHHVSESFEKYQLNEIGYSRLIYHKDRKITYFEKLLATRERPQIFNRNDFEWAWSKPKKTTKKEQLPALHGIYKKTGQKWWAWHGLGENQLHFSGEKHWWPKANSRHAITFNSPTESQKISFEHLADLLKDT